MTAPSGPDPGSPRRRVRRRVRVEGSEAGRTARRQWHRVRRGARRVAFWGGVILAGAVLLYLAFSRINVVPPPPE